MTPIIDKYIGQDLLKQAMSKNTYNEECIKEFIMFLDDFLTGLEQDNAIDEDRTGADLLTVPIAYTNYYAKRRNEGFSIAWSKKYADNKISDDTRNLLMDCYETSEKQDRQQANADLMTYFKLTNRDQVFIDYFFYRISNDARFGKRSIEKDVEEFVSHYNEKISEGKSTLYAWQYAAWLINDYNPIFCEEYAYIYEDSIKKGKSEEYAYEYAYKYANELVNIKGRFGISDDEEMLDFAREKVKAHIIGWEYAKNNKIKNCSVFMECYNNAYFNTLYPDDPTMWKTIEQCEKIVLDKALEDYEKIKNK
jgi:hypothetical protein